MRVTVFGSSGMLGTEVCSELVRAGHSVIACTHVQGTICDYKFVSRVTEDADAVINCAGMINHGMPSDIIKANAVGPWIIAQNFSGQILHVSTDCVFGGLLPGVIHYTTDTPSPVDLYGRSKLLGECRFAHVVNVRTSFIGFRHGLLKWLVDNRDGEVYGRTACSWSGSTVQAVAEGLVKALTLEGKRNIEHLAIERSMSKHDALVYINNLLKLGIKIKPTDRPVVNRAIRATIVMPSILEREDDFTGRYFSGYTSRPIREQSSLAGRSSSFNRESDSQARTSAFNK